ncbi:hypothetical protein BAE44_0014133 [Dichanthelium oligosanthes]|uniref:KIB1-4 beta-propeller domain-containing protein n=1 Tax=Dichanthelium oligosanthes TaxID=888268 RepID=A0A1E5VIC4_9POAL|nr:hypothetical protein BAE44_0014133 [Dichanthelium oligosanthes]
MPEPDWSSGLPSEHLEDIGKLLASGTDAALFRSVCSPWRDAVPFAPSFAPVLLLPFGPGSDRVTLYSVVEGKAFSRPLPDDDAARGNKVPCGLSCGWLALMDASAAVTLLNPFTGARVELPPADERVAAASSMFVSKEDGRWVLHPVNDYGNAAAGCTITLEEMRQFFFLEIVLSAPPDADGRGCVAMAVLPSSTEVAFCRVGVDSAWTLLETYLECSVDSVVHCQGRFLAIDCTGEISICSNIATGGTPTTTPMPSLSAPEELCHRSYLESNGELYVVGVLVDVFRWAQRFDYSSVVYRCNLQDPSPAWTRVNDAGDLTLFVSNHFRHSFGGTSVSRLNRNTIYFSDPLYLYGVNQYRSDHCLEIADIATGTWEVKPFHQKVQGLKALGGIRPNLWRGRGM